MNRMDYEAWDDVMEWEKLVDELHEDERKYLALKRYYEDRETSILVSTDFKKIYGANNDKIRKQWKKLLGNSKPTGEYLKVGSTVRVEIIENYSDMELGRDLKVGEVVNMRRARANLIVGCGKGVIVK